LPAYFSEQKRWAEHWRRVELERMSAQKSEADLRLTLLQAQVEPHFLFNTLASVRSLVASDPQRASQTIDALARHLRETLPKFRAGTGIAHSTLGEQFAICASYLELMQVRLGERLRVEINLPDELRSLPFPPLLLISLVENAIKHGVEPKPGVTCVVLSARTIDDAGVKRLEVDVEDDGAGLKLGMGEGTGLANIRAQLLTRFASAASLDLSGRSAGGVLARLVVPLEPAAV
jgi:sensor histidine kinase YesM